MGITKPPWPVPNFRCQKFAKLRVTSYTLALSFLCSSWSSLSQTSSYINSTSEVQNYPLNRPLLRCTGNRRPPPRDPLPSKGPRAPAKGPIRTVEVSIADVPGLSDDRTFARPERNSAQQDTISPSRHDRTSEEDAVKERIRLLELRLAESQKGAPLENGFEYGLRSSQANGGFDRGGAMRGSGEADRGAYKFMSGLATMHRGTGGANELQAAYEKKLQYQKELGASNILVLPQQKNRPDA
jgi:hypothetical protein